MAALYGAGAYTGSNPIGGGMGYVSSHGYSQASADYVVTSLSGLKSALASATSGKVIWIPNDTTITAPDSSPIGTLKSGAVLASNRGSGGVAGGRLQQPHPATSFMTPLIWASSNSVISGLQFVGPGGLASTTGPRNCGIRGIDGTLRIEVENCDIGNFCEGGVYFKSGGMTWNDDGPNGRHWVHHCYIHHIQKHGYGYGVSAEGTCSYLVETCNIEHCRHLTMGQEGGIGAYEARYNIFGDADYRLNGTGAWYHNQQVDWHGAHYTPYSCAYSLIHHNTFSANDTYSPKPNVGIRGPAKYYVKVYNNWTKKTSHSGLYSETTSNAAFTPLTSNGGGTSSTPASYNMQVYDNWYGTTAPPGGGGGGGGTTAPVVSFSGTPLRGEAPMEVTFTDLSSNTPTAWAWSFGDGGVSALQNPTHTYTTAGTWDVSLLAQNSGGSNTGTRTDYITTYESTDVQADFSADPVSGAKPLTVAFTNLSLNADTYSWDFGDGSTSTSTSPSHNYTRAGVFDVALTASTSTASASLDVGSAASDRVSSASPAGYTDIMLDNPLNATGTLNSIEIFATVNMTGVKVGTFYLSSGTTYICRDVVEIGNVTAGSKQTFTTDAGANPIALSGSVGDCIGLHCDTGSLEYTNTSGAGFYYVAGDYCNEGASASYLLFADRDYSLYASGTNAGATESDTETKAGYITVTAPTATSSTLKAKIMLMPKPKLKNPGMQVSHMLANSKGGAW